MVWERLTAEFVGLALEGIKKDMMLLTAIHGEIHVTFLVLDHREPDTIRQYTWYAQQVRILRRRWSDSCMRGQGRRRVLS